MKIKKILAVFLPLLLLPLLTSCSEKWSSLEKAEAERILNDAYYVTYNSDFSLKEENYISNKKVSSYTYLHSTTNSSALTISFSYENGLEKIEKKNLLEKKENGFLISYDYFSNESKNTTYYNDKPRSINDFFPSEIRKANLSFLTINGERSSNGNYKIKLMRSDEMILEYSIKDFGISEINGTRRGEREKYVFSYQNNFANSFSDSEKEEFNIRFLRDTKLLEEKTVIAGNSFDYSGSATEIAGTPESPFSGWSEDTSVAYKDSNLQAVYGNDFPDYKIVLYTLENNEYKPARTLSVKRGSNFQLPTAPSYEGKKFRGWGTTIEENETNELYSGLFMANSNLSLYAKYEVSSTQYLASFTWEVDYQEKSWVYWVDKGKTLQQCGITTIPVLNLPANYSCKTAEVNNNIYSYSEIFTKNWSESYFVNNVLNVRLIISKSSSGAKTLRLLYNNSTFLTFSVEPNSILKQYLIQAENGIKESVNQNVAGWLDKNGTLYKSSKTQYMPDEDLSLNCICSIGNNPRTLHKYGSLNVLDYNFRELDEDESTIESNKIESSLFTTLSRFSPTTKSLEFKDNQNESKTAFVNFFGSSNLQDIASSTSTAVGDSKTFDDFYNVFPDPDEKLVESKNISRNKNVFSKNNLSISFSEFYGFQTETFDTAFYIDDFISPSDDSRIFGSLVAAEIHFVFNTTITTVSISAQNSSKKSVAYLFNIQKILNLEKSSVVLSWLDLKKINGNNSSALYYYKSVTEPFLYGAELVKKSLECGSPDELSAFDSRLNYLTSIDRIKVTFDGSEYKISNYTNGNSSQQNTTRNLKLGTNSLYFTDFENSKIRGKMEYYSIVSPKGEYYKDGDEIVVFNSKAEAEEFIKNDVVLSGEHYTAVVNGEEKHDSYSCHSNGEETIEFEMKNNYSDNFKYSLYYSGTKISYPRETMYYYSVDAEPYGKATGTNRFSNILWACNLVRIDSSEPTLYSLKNGKTVTEFGSKTLDFIFRSGNFNNSGYTFNREGQIIVADSYSDFLYKMNGYEINWRM